MSPFGPDRDLTDAELDAALATANSDLAQYVHACFTPRELLLALMDRVASVRGEQDPVRHNPGEDSAIMLIAQRRLTRASIHDLARALELTHSLRVELACAAGTSTITGALGYARNLSLELAHDLDQIGRLADAFDCSSGIAFAPVNFDRALARARRFVSSLCLELLDNVDLVRARRLTCDLARDVANAHGFAEDLLEELETAPIDVCGADLAHLNLGPHGVQVLVGAVWTRDTRWPPGLASELTEQSEEIRPGVYQVRSGNERHPLNLGSI